MESIDTNIIDIYQRILENDAAMYVQQAKKKHNKNAKILPEGKRFSPRFSALERARGDASNEPFVSVVRKV
jgi:hypothetical protein